MSFAAETGKLVNDLIQAEYKKACKDWGAYNSLHEGYAVLLEEMEEVEDCVEKLEEYKNLLWRKIKCSTFKLYTRREIVTRLEDITKNTMSELAQVGAVLMKIKNALEVEE